MSEEPNQPAIKAVTFDLDGLMFNTEDVYQEVGVTVLARRGKEFTEELRNQMMGRKAPDALQRMIDYHELPDTTDQLAEESAEVFGSLLEEKLQPMPGLLDLLSSLEKAQIPKGIATSSGRVFVEHILRLTDLRERFEFILTAEDITHGKPAPDVYLLAAERHGVKPTEMLVLEDSEIGCRAAIAAHAFCVAVPSEHSSTHTFDGVKFMAESLADDRIFAALSLT
ncbi:HAD family hydrolase [Adhaeretor mobilis]|uniref:Phosphorylated carbohydrates phosphatase n=1 Tax=Adhaeretor mobilis TaxID=1930276 RepID=A0A517MU95_9BACT|nr:HAD family phosphatase [Adhaeretor mobilis]QDS98449.1 Phosphorylated carbohydrates phosphatase [Adhaeretor mobilis]